LRESVFLGYLFDDFEHLFFPDFILCFPRVFSHYPSPWTGQFLLMYLSQNLPSVHPHAHMVSSGHVGIDAYTLVSGRVPSTYVVLVDISDGVFLGLSGTRVPLMTLM
jgi:hypothetical protein